MDKIVKPDPATKRRQYLHIKVIDGLLVVVMVVVVMVVVAVVVVAVVEEGVGLMRQRCTQLRICKIINNNRIRIIFTSTES